jgi:hypothetical protein
MSQKGVKQAEKKESGKNPAFAFATKSSVHSAVLIVLTIALFGKFMFSDKMLSSSDQVAGIDSRVVLRDAIVEDGQFPTWFPSRLGGMPSIDAMFGDAMYLPSLLLYAAFPMHRALGLTMIIHVALAGIFFYLMMVRGFGAHPFVGLISAALYMLNPEFVSHVYPGHSGKMMVIAWLPFVVWRMKILMERMTPCNVSLLAFGVAACLYTSHIQMTYFVLWGLFLYCVMSIALRWKKEPAIRRFMPLGVLMGAVFLGLGLAFIQFFPPFMFVRDAHSVRGVEKGFEYAASWSLHWPEFFSLWVPEFGNFLENYWSENPFKLNSEYAGMIALLLSVFAVAFKPKPWRIFWAAIAVLAVLYSMGRHTPVFHIAYYLIPGVKRFRAGSMMMFWFSFSVVLLAAMFLSDIARGELAAMEEKRKAKWQKGIFIVLAAITAFSVLFSARGFVSGLMQGALADPRKARVFEQNFGQNFVPALWMWWASAVVIIGLILAVMKGKVSRSILYLAVIAIGLFDTIRIDSKFIQVVNPRRYFFEHDVIKDLQEKMKKTPFRCFTFPGTFSQNAEGIFGLEGVGGFHDNELRWYREFRGDQRNSNYFHGIVMQDAQGRSFLNAANLRTGNNFLNIANVRYYLTGQGGRLMSMENQGALGRISFAPNYVVMEEQATLAALKKNTYDIRHTVALLEEPEVKPEPFVLSDSLPQPLPVADVSWEKYTTNYRKARVTVPRDGFLRISEVHYPGWEILVDGKTEKIYRADVAWMAVQVGAGEHTVEMMPKSMYLGKAAFVSFPLIILLLVYWAATGALAFRKKSNSSEGSKDV